MIAETAVPMPSYPHVVVKGGARPRMRCLHCRASERLPICIVGDEQEAMRELRRQFSGFLMQHRSCPVPKEKLH